MVRYGRKRKQQRRKRMGVGIAVVAVAVAGGWWLLRNQDSSTSVEPTPLAIADLPPENAQPEPALERAAPPEDVQLAAHEEIIKPPDQPVTESGAPVVAVAHLDEDPVDADPTPVSGPGSAAIEKIRRLYAGGKVVEARHQLNALLNRELSESVRVEARALLARIADDTIFGRRAVPNDPLVEMYTVQSGDYLVNIGKKYDVPPEILMDINSINDPRKIRVNQRLKVIRGPFHARIDKSEFRLDLYLGDLYVRSYPVGLGLNDGTPLGKWRVKDKLENPTFYPPASSDVDRVIPANDPNNPLGEHWIGLEGVAGDAVGHGGYGIHGTIDPDSIGKAVSLGCVRMRNEDVAKVYRVLLPGRSTVTIEP